MLVFTLLALLATSVGGQLISTRPFTVFDITTTLDGHNDARDEVCSPRLTWNPAIAAIAQSYSETCQLRHSANGYGENLYGGSSFIATAGMGVASWVDEKYTWTCGTPPGIRTGHYTQVVWNTTAQIGCGASICTMDLGNGPVNLYWMVCNYFPSGNNGLPFDPSYCSGGTINPDLKCASVAPSPPPGDNCDILQDICWEQCGRPDIFPFAESCRADAVSGGVYECYSPPGCTCNIPAHLRSSAGGHPHPTQCTVRDCNSYDWTGSDRSKIDASNPTSIGWCQACGYDCGGNQAACINNNNFCKVNSRCAQLDMCSRVRPPAPTTAPPTNVPTAAPPAPTAPPTVPPTSPPAVPTNVPTVAPPTPTVAPVAPTPSPDRTDHCRIVRDICWEKCGKPKIFPFMDSCHEGYDGKIVGCVVPDDCDCPIPPEHLNNTAPLPYCKQYNCFRAFSNTQPGAPSWCQACGYNCGGYQQNCISDNNFCKTVSRCSQLDMCQDWRDDNCRDANGNIDPKCGVVEYTPPRAASSVAEEQPESATSMASLVLAIVACCCLSVVGAGLGWVLRYARSFKHEQRKRNEFEDERREKKRAAHQAKKSANAPAARNGGRTSVVDSRRVVDNNDDLGDVPLRMSNRGDLDRSNPHSGEGTPRNSRTESVDDTYQQKNNVAGDDSIV